MERQISKTNEDTDILVIVGIAWAYRNVIIICLLLSFILSLIYSFNKKPTTDINYLSQASIYFPLIDKNHSAYLAIELITSHANYLHLMSNRGESIDLDYQDYLSRLDVKINAQTVKVQYSADTKEESLSHLTLIWDYTDQQLRTLAEDTGFYVLDKPFYLWDKTVHKEVKRALIVLMGLIIGFTFGVIISFLLFSIKKIKSSPEALMKVKGEFIE